MKFYIANTFSPMMMHKGPTTTALLAEVPLYHIQNLVQKYEVTSIISHELTAPVISALVGKTFACNRVNVELKADDVLLCVIPAFRATEAREFTEEEVRTAGYRCFVIGVRQDQAYE